MLCLGPVAGGGETEVLKLLDVLLSTEVEAQKKQKVLQEEFYIPMAPKFAEEVVEMCNLSKGVSWSKAWRRASCGLFGLPWRA